MLHRYPRGRLRAVVHRYAQVNPVSRAELDQVQADIGRSLDTLRAVIDDCVHPTDVPTRWR